MRPAAGESPAAGRSRRGQRHHAGGPERLDRLEQLSDPLVEVLEARRGRLVLLAPIGGRPLQQRVLLGDQLGQALQLLAGLLAAALEVEQLALQGRHLQLQALHVLVPGVGGRGEKRCGRDERGRHGGSADHVHPPGALEESGGPHHSSRAAAQRRDREVRAAVPGVGLLGRRRVDRLLLAEGDGAQPLGRDTEAHQVVPRGPGPLVPERQVVLDGAARVAVTLDGHARVAMALEPDGVAVERRAGGVAERGGVVGRSGCRRAGRPRRSR